MKTRIYAAVKGLSKLDYYNGFLYNVPNGEINRLHGVQYCLAQVALASDLLYNIICLVTYKDIRLYATVNKST